VEVEVSPTIRREDFPFESRFVDVLDARMHYVEVGQGRPILFLHGNPTWSYVWRNVLPLVAAEGRAIAVDLVGMGRSSKPEILYRFADHAAYLDGFIKALGLRNLSLVLHDWGSALGFHYACRHEDHVRALAFFEAILAPVPGWGAFPREARAAFQSFRDPERGVRLIIEENKMIEEVLPAGISRTLTEREMEFYREPYVEPKARAPLWRWPNEIPIAGQPQDVHEVVTQYNDWLKKTLIPKLLLHADPGGLTDERAVDWCRGALRNLTTVDLGAGLHCLQEDHPEFIGRSIASWLRTLD
jgi:haloalkane dehalogenase